VPARSSPEFDYVTVGHVTADLIQGERTPRPGGGAFYSALQASRLGLRSLIVTKGEPRELERLLAPFAAELEIRILPSEHTTTLLTSGSGADRRQRLLAWAGAIDEHIEVDTGILHLASVARETPAHFEGQAGFVGLTPQGLVREWDSEGSISLVTLARDGLPARFDAVVISEVELACCDWLLPAPTTQSTPQAAASPKPAGTSEPAAGVERGLVVVTAGAAPITVHSPAGSASYPPAPQVSDPQDDLGAGDVFAAALFVALAQGQTVGEAVAYGSAAAAVRLTAAGPQAVGTRAEVLERLTRG
jgi:sugar/nucleoside kinase (ribokinase family)